MSLVTFEADAQICIITINRPAKRNAVDGPTARALRGAFERFEADPALRVAILTGAGDNFCAGADLSAVGDPALRNELDPEGGGAGPMGPSRMALSKPLIAALSGYAVAGGLELALLADLRVMERDAVFGVFCRRWGVPLIDGGTVRLPRIVGQGRALEIILTGRKVPADECLAIGLCEYLTPKGGARAKAEELAQEIARFPQVCVRADRRSAIRSHGMSVRDALIQEWYNGREALVKDGVAGAARFKDGLGRHGDFGKIR